MGRQTPTLEDVAREAGVSRATVSRVVNGVRNVDPALREIVHRAIEVTGYAPNRAARSLVIRRTETVALVVSGVGDVADDDTRDAFAARVFTDPFFGRVVGGVVGFLRPRSMHPVLMFAESADDRREVLTFLRQGRADGALVVSTHADDPLPALLAEAGLPAVLFARPARPVPLSHVDVDNRAGGRLAARHLLARGCCRPATVTGPLDVSAGRERLAGFRAALTEAGLTDVPFVEGGFTLAGGAEAMDALLARHPDVDGVFAANDLMAEGVCRLLQERGGRVPDDVAVVGFDDSGVAAACRPALTSVRQPVERMAQEMARLLDEHIRGERTEPTAVVFDPELVTRDSA
ncbi:LacI family transcriptional regulator [Streptomyces sp. Ru71]|uniref:LacI family DNA-binding transcriptional regulator n=1 Tax=Streptomyces sp. Ru71 TaxID=2080746 RepID=UPI000CDE1BEB|nr:LacI family DNA-binding transcriptional regulator [Streptomyces sp. Ru71]POX57304.1 LacI family transcriptional regulator [Streptomyces sp. Ru71]